MNLRNGCGSVQSIPEVLSLILSPAVQSTAVRGQEALPLAGFGAAPQIIPSPINVSQKGHP